ncbi:MAG: 16S rRNA (uracil(1498)-N(3))-methyltransferase [Acidobacteriota bacterium]
MNLLLVEPAELRADGTCALADRRAHHLRDVLRVRAGDEIRAGVLGGGVGRARVISDDGETIVLAIAADQPARPQLAVELVLAVPRPKVLSRVVETCAAFGVARVDLTNAWRVDKSYLESPRLAADALAHAARLGAEQGATTHVPALAVHARLMALLDARFAAPGGALRLIAHPDAPPIERAVTARGPVVLAIGPEGGWIARELDTFVARGFVPVAIGTPILRVEAAVAAALGQLLLLQRIAAS